MVVVHFIRVWFIFFFFFFFFWFKTKQQKKSTQIRVSSSSSSSSIRATYPSFVLFQSSTLSLIITPSNTITMRNWKNNIQNSWLYLNAKANDWMNESINDVHWLNDWLTEWKSDSFIEKCDKDTPSLTLLLFVVIANIIIIKYIISLLMEKEKSNNYSMIVMWCYVDSDVWW